MYWELLITKGFLWALAQLQCGQPSTRLRCKLHSSGLQLENSQRMSWFECLRIFAGSSCTCLSGVPTVSSDQSHEVCVCASSRYFQIVPISITWCDSEEARAAYSHVLGDGSTTSAATLDRIHRNICGNNCRKLMWKIVEPCTGDSFQFSWNPHPFAWSFGFVLGPGPVIPFEFQAFCGKRAASASRVSTFLWGTLTCVHVCVCAHPEFQNHLLYACFARFMRFLPTLPAKNINNQFSFMTFLVVREDFSKLVWVSEGVFQKCFKNQLGHGKPRKFAELSMRVSSLCQKRSNFYGQDNSEFPIAVRRVIWCLQIVTTLKNE